MKQEIINLFDEYTHKPLDRKEFMSRLIKLTGSVAAANLVLPLLEANAAYAGTIRQDDPDIVAKDVTYPANGKTMKGYLVQPTGKGKHGSVIVIHENRGLTAHIRDIARRLAKAGFNALSVDALSVNGGTPANEDEARDLIGKLDPKDNLNNYLDTFKYLKSLPGANGKTACIGFCWGGGLANQLAVNDPDLKAAIAFYGRQPAAEEVKKIKAAIQLHYAGLDERINAGIPAYEAALKADGIKYELYMYEGVQHAFNNDASPARYNEAAAKLAWERTLKFLTEKIA